MPRWSGQIAATTGQLTYEWTHLCRKLAVRDPARLAEFFNVQMSEAHPLFRIVEGSVASWEKI